jgi:hypothetical protein
LNKLNIGYEDYTTKKKVSHMNNLKHIGKTKEKLQTQMQVVRTFSTEFGLHKCAKVELNKATLIHSPNLILDFNIEIQELKQ